MNAPVQNLAVPQQIDDDTRASVDDLVTIAGCVEVATAADYDFAASQLQLVKGRIKALKDSRINITRPLDQAKKHVMALYKGPLEALEKCETSLKGVMLAYDNEQDRIRRERERLAREAEEAERRRIQEQAEAQAKAAEKAGDVQAAQEIKAQAEIEQQSVVAVAKKTEAPAASGISRREVWKAEVTSMAELVQAAASGNEQAMALLVVDNKALQQQAKALKSAFTLPGIRVFSEKQLAARSR